MTQTGETPRTHPGVLASLWRYRYLAVAIVFAMTLLSIVAGLLVSPPPTASASIALAVPPANSVLAPGLQGDAALARYTAQRADYVRSDAVLEVVAEALGRDDLTNLRRDISTTPSQRSNTITIRANAGSAEEAVDLADAVVAAYRSQTESEVMRLTDAAVASIDASADEVMADVEANPDSGAVQTAAAETLSALAVQSSELRTSSAVFGDGVEFVVAPRTNAVLEPGFPRREAGLGFVVGWILAATAAWILADRERQRD